MRATPLVACLLLAAATFGGHAMDAPSIPAGPPDDAIMASAQESRQVHDWVMSAFAGAAADGRVPLTVIRQDHSVLQYGRSCIDTPLRIGAKHFEHGLGTHANSEILVAVPVGASRFRASAGVDNNDDTGGVRGTVVFEVEADGKVLLTTPTLRGGAEPYRVDVPIPAGARTLTLKVSDAGDGAAFDQADWADAALQVADGSTVRLDDCQNTLLLGDGEPPFSFACDGAPVRLRLASWQRTVEEREENGRTHVTARWRDPGSGLQVTAEVTAFERYGAASWVLYLENTGTKDSPMLDAIQALDVGLRSGYAKRPLLLHQLQGDACGEGSFLPLRSSVETGKRIRLAPTGGRPSSISAFPWFNLEYADGGAITAIGWTGQWAASIDRAGTGPARLVAGMEATHLRLHPGERIRTPRILLMPWQGDRQRAHLRFRRLVMHEFAPKLDGTPARMPVALQTFDRYWQRPGWPTESGQMDYAKMARDLGCESLWLDAAWFPRMFPTGVGTWYCDPSRFPRGLKPVSDLCHQAGMRFILWFEPERVAPDTEISREHPEFVHGGATGGLFKLDDPAARRWLTDVLAKRIEEYGVDVYRNDFNVDPLPYWRAADAPDRQGMTEIRYVEGLYAMWDELRARHPGLLIDNCSSGGRRIDLEMCSRSVPLWRSDTGCSPGHPEWNQMQSMALALYVPLYAISSWSPSAYETRSAATSGVSLEWPYLEAGFPTALAKQTIAEARDCAPYWHGDLYALTPTNTSLDQFTAWQLNRADLGAGIVLAFRRPECPYNGLILGLRGLQPDARYRVEFVDDGRHITTRRMSGKQLADDLPLRLPDKGTSLLVRYQRIEGPRPSEAHE